MCLASIVHSIWKWNSEYRHKDTLNTDLYHIDEALQTDHHYNVACPFLYFIESIRQLQKKWKKERKNIPTLYLIIYMCYFSYFNYWSAPPISVTTCARPLSISHFDRPTCPTMMCYDMWRNIILRDWYANHLKKNLRVEDYIKFCNKLMLSFEIHNITH